MKRLLALSTLLSAALLCYAEDAAAEFVKRAKKLEQEEGAGRIQLANHCEKTKMWKEAAEEWQRALDIFPDNKEATERQAKAQERADTVVSRPSATDLENYKTALAMVRKGLGKKWRDLATWAKSKSLADEEEQATAMADELEAVKKEAKGPMESAINVLNVQRKKCKLKPVVLSVKLSDGAQKHTDYLIKNDAHPSTKGLGCHKEDESLPGYTPEGAWAGMHSDIGSAEPPHAMADMLTTFYHRIPLLHPDLAEVGIGYTKRSGGGGGGRWGGGGGRCAIDYSGKGDKDEKSPRIVAYPAENSTGVFLSFGNEEPDPIPEGADHDAGFPITLTFFDSPSVTDATVELTVEGVTVDGYLSSPEKPARSDFPNEDSIAFIPKKPLDGKAKYHVKVTAKVNGEDYVKEWDFTTGTRSR